MFYKSLPMTGFELQISGVGSDRFTNWAKTTALKKYCYFKFRTTYGQSS